MTTTPDIEPAKRLTLTLALRPDEAARALSISRRTLFTLTDTGAIRCAKIGRAKLYAVSELERFLAERATPVGK